MSKDVKTIVGVSYSVTLTQAGTVQAKCSNGSLITLVTLGQPGQATFQAVTSVTVVSDDAAVVLPFHRFRYETGSDGDGVTEEKVLVLIDEALSANAEIATPNGSEDSHYYYADIPAKYITPGELHSIALRGPQQILDAYGSPAYLSVWQEQAPGTDDFQPVAVSSNAVTLEANKLLEWSFDGGMLSRNRIRFCLLDTDAEGAVFRRDLNIRSRVSETVAWQEGHIFQPSVANRLPEMVICVAVPVSRFAPNSHTADSVAHLTEEEHAGLTALLEHKEEILALFPAVSTTEMIEPESGQAEEDAESDGINKPVIEPPGDDLLPTPTPTTTQQ